MVWQYLPQKNKKHYSGVHIPRRAIVQRSGVLKVCRAISERYEWLSQVSTSNHPCPRSFSAFKQQLDVRFPRGSIVHAKVTTTHNHSCRDSHNHSCWSYHRYRFIFPPSTNHFTTLSLLYYSQVKPWFHRLTKSVPIHHLVVPVSFLYLWNKFPPISNPQKSTNMVLWILIRANKITRSVEISEWVHREGGESSVHKH